MPELPKPLRSTEFRKILDEYTLVAIRNRVLFVLERSSLPHQEKALNAMIGYSHNSLNSSITSSKLVLLSLALNCTLSSLVTDVDPILIFTMAAHEFASDCEIHTSYFELSSAVYTYWGFKHDDPPENFRELHILFPDDRWPIHSPPIS